MGRFMKRFFALFVPVISTLFAASSIANTSADENYVQSIQAWRTGIEQSLKRDNGWLTLAARYMIKPGENTIGTTPDNDIVVPAGLGPARLGSIVVDGKMVELKLNDGIAMKAKEGEFTGARVFATEAATRDWVSLGRMAFHVIERRGRFMLRLADNENPARKDFSGRVWYQVKEEYKVAARFVPYPPGKTIPIIDVIDEVHETPTPGYIEFTLNGQRLKLDATGELDDKELFIVLKDQTAGGSTYNAGRFLAVEWPEAVRRSGGPVTIDFNKVYNPPCAFSAFTTCPLPPRQNQLKVRLEAGERYPARQIALN